MKAAKLQTVTAPAVEPAPLLPLDQMSREAVVDEFSELDARVKAFAPTKNRHELLGKTIRGWYAELPGDQTATATGNKFDVTLGLADEERSIVSMPTLFRQFGQAKFLQACSMTLKAVEERFGAAAAAKFFKRARTGPRKLFPVPRLSEASAMPKAA